MIAFITSVRHPKNSTNYQKIELLLARTLKSISSQTNEDFCVIVVCNQVPSVPVDSAKIHFVKVDFPPPSTITGARIENSAILKDKGTKYLIGLKKAEEFNPEYVMFFDADDLFHKGIADYVNSHPGENGWFFEEGYVYRDGGLLLAKVDNFYQVCGSSHILKFDRMRPPKELSVTSNQQTILDTVDNDYLFKILGGHRSTAAWSQEQGLPLQPFPFPAAIWLTETGENHSGVRFFGKPSMVSTEVTTNFNFELPNDLALKLVTIFYYYPYGCIRALLRAMKKRLKS